MPHSSCARGICNEKRTVGTMPTVWKNLYRRTRLRCRASLPPSGGGAAIRTAHRSTYGNNPAKKERSFSAGQGGTHPGAAHPYTPTQPAKAQRHPQAHTRPFARRRARRRLRSASSAACSKAQRLRANCFSRWRRSCLLRNRTRS